MLQQPILILLRRFTIICAIVLCPCLSAAQEVSRKSLSDGSTRPIRLVGMTTPTHESILGPVQRGSLKSVVVREGALVKQGDLLFTLDDRVQQIRIAIAKASAESMLDIERAKARWDQAKHNLERLTDLLGQDQSSAKEFQDAKTKEEMARLDHEIVQFEHKQAQLVYQREQAQADLYRIRAPFDGYIAARMMDTGASLEENDEVLKLVQLDPLRVALDCPLSVARSLALGDRINVSPTDAHWPGKAGTVNFVSRVVDAASQTMRINILVENTDNAWPAGLKVNVTMLHVKGSVSQASRR